MLHDGGDESPQYSHLSDDEFLDVLRQHLSDRSWTFEQWLELEHRGFEVVDSDTELMQAVTHERQKLNDAMRPMLEHLQIKIFGDLQPLQEQLKRITESIAPKVDLSEIIPKIAGTALTDPAYLSFIDQPFPPRLRADHQWAAKGLDRPAAEMLGEVAAWQEERMTAEAEDRRTHLEAAVATVAQLEVLQRVEQVVSKAAKRGWYDWLLLGLAAIAAVAAVVAVVIAPR